MLHNRRGPRLVRWPRAEDRRRSRLASARQRGAAAHAISHRLIFSATLSFLLSLTSVQPEAIAPAIGCTLASACMRILNGWSDGEGGRNSLPSAPRRKGAERAATRRDTSQRLARNWEHVCWHCRMKRWTTINANPLHQEESYGEEEIAEMDIRVGGAARGRRARRLRPDAHDGSESRE